MRQRDPTPTPMILRNVIHPRAGSDLPRHERFGGDGDEAVGQILDAAVGDDEEGEREPR